MLRTKYQDVGLYTLLLELLDRVLRRLRLVLLGCCDKGDISQMNADAMVLELPLELTYTLQEGKRLDISDHTTYLGDDKVVGMLQS